MNDYNDYNYNPDIDYYTVYTNNSAKDASRAVSRYALALFLYLLISNVIAIGVEVIIILAMGAEAAGRLFAENIYIQWLLGVGPMYLIGFPVFYLIIRNMKTFIPKKTKLDYKEFIALFAIGEAFMFVGNTIGTTLNSFISSLLGHEVQNSTADLIEKSPLWLIFIIVVVIGPIIEELLFRKLLIDRLGRFGARFAIILSAIGFGLFHGNFYQFFYTTLLGLVLGYIYVNTRNVKYTVIMHMLVNFLGSFVSLLLISRLDEFEKIAEALEAGILENIDMTAFVQNLMVIASYSIVQYTIWFSGLAVLVTYFLHRKFNVKRLCEVNLSGFRLTEASLLNVGSILFILLSLGQFALSIFM